jgi:hypothetical protein
MTPEQADSGSSSRLPELDRQNPEVGITFTGLRQVLGYHEHAGFKPIAVFEDSKWPAKVVFTQHASDNLRIWIRNKANYGFPRQSCSKPYGSARATRERAPPSPGRALGSLCAALIAFVDGAAGHR